MDKPWVLAIARQDTDPVDSTRRNKLLGGNSKSTLLAPPTEVKWNVIDGNTGLDTPAWFQQRSTPYWVPSTSGYVMALCTACRHTEKPEQNSISSIVNSTGWTLKPKDCESSHTLSRFKKSCGTNLDTDTGINVLAGTWATTWASSFPHW